MKDEAMAHEPHKHGAIGHVISGVASVSYPPAPVVISSNQPPKDFNASDAAAFALQQAGTIKETVNRLLARMKGHEATDLPDSKKPDLAGLKPKLEILMQTQLTVLAKLAELEKLL